MSDQSTPNFLDAADPAAFGQAMALPLEQLERLVEESVCAMGAATPELRRLAGYCEAMLRRLSKAAPTTNTTTTDRCAKRGAVNLDAGELRAVRFAVLVGLQSFGEIERLINRAEVFADRLPDGMRPNHPTGQADTVSKFAEALAYLEQAREVSHD